MFSTLHRARIAKHCIESELIVLHVVLCFVLRMVLCLMLCLCCALCCFRSKVEIVSNLLPHASSKAWHTTAVCWCGHVGAGGWCVGASRTRGARLMTVQQLEKMLVLAKTKLSSDSLDDRRDGARLIRTALTTSEDTSLSEHVACLGIESPLLEISRDDANGGAQFDATASLSMLCKDILMHDLVRAESFCDCRISRHQTLMNHCSLDQEFERLLLSPEGVIREQAAIGLANMADGGPEHLEGSAMDAVITAMHIAFDAKHTGVARAGMRFLQRMCCRWPTNHVPSVRRAFEAMFQYFPPSDAHTCADALKIVACAADLPEFAPAIASNPSMSQILDCVVHGDKDVLHSASLALLNLSAGDASIAMRMAEAGAIGRIAAGLQRSIDEESCVALIWCLSNVCTNGAEFVESVLAQDGVVGVIFEYMGVRHGMSVREAGVRFISNLAHFGNNNHRRLLLRQGCIAPCSSCLSDVHLYDEASSTLLKLSKVEGDEVHDGEMRRMLLEGGAPDIFKECVKRGLKPVENAIRLQERWFSGKHAIE